jgi:hypothetical protein
VPQIAKRLNGVAHGKSSGDERIAKGVRRVIESNIRKTRRPRENRNNGNENERISENSCHLSAGLAVFAGKDM